MAKLSFLFLTIMMSCSETVMVLALFFMICCDVELNPGPYENVNLKIAHLNIRSLNAPHKFGEVSSAILNHKFDVGVAVCVQHLLLSKEKKT